MRATLTLAKQFGLGLNHSTKKTRKREFCDEMDRVVPWSPLVQVVGSGYPKAETDRPPFGIEGMLHIHCPQQWFALSGTAMEEALHEMQVFREFAKLDDGAARLPWQLGPCGARPFVLWKGSVGWEPAAPERLLPVDLDRRAHAAWHQAVARCGGGGSDDGQLNKVQRSSDG